MREREWSHKQTLLRIKSDSEEAIQASIEASYEARKDLEKFISDYPEFKDSLEPLNMKRGEHPRIIDLMIRAGEIAEIGPFSAVAGTISQIAAESGFNSGAKNIMVDNGGDIEIIGRKDFKVGIYAGESQISGRLILSIKAEELPAGVCTSSSTVGHSMSFGNADAVVVTSNEASISDAAATSIANEVAGEEVESSVKKGLDKADDISEIRGCMVVREDYVGTVGKLPDINLLREGEEVKPPELENQV